MQTLAYVPWEGATGKLTIGINENIYFYDNYVLKHSEPFASPTKNLYIYVLTSTYRPNDSGTDAFSNFYFVQPG